MIFIEQLRLLTTLGSRHTVITGQCNGERFTLIIRVNVEQ